MSYPTLRRQFSNKSTNAWGEIPMHENQTLTNKLTIMATFTSKEINSIQNVLNQHLDYYCYTKLDKNWITFEPYEYFKKLHVMKLSSVYSLDIMFKKYQVSEFHDNIKSLCNSIKTHLSIL